MESTPTIEELSARLKASQDALHRSECLAAVAQHAVDAMHEAASPLEIIGNLHYLIRLSSRSPKKVLEYLGEAEIQARRLYEITVRIHGAHKNALKDAEGTEYLM